MKAIEWLKRAKKEKFAIGAFNAASIETLKAVVGAAKKLRSPVIIEASHSEVEFIGLHELTAAVRALEKDTGVPIMLNLDHAPSLVSCHAAITSGFDLVHFDGSKLPYEKNLEIAKIVTEEAHGKGIVVEGEIDNINALGASSSDHRRVNIETVRDEKLYTDPDKAAQFVKETKVDIFASFIGNVHGLYSEAKTLRMDLLLKIVEKLPETFLSLHGGSGIPADQIKEAINAGIVKINVNSELRVAFRDALKKTLEEETARDEVAIYKIMPEAIAAMQKVVEEKILLFGSAGKI